MRILDENNKEIFGPDLHLGYLKEEKIFIAHHEAVDAVAEKGHYETIAEYPNGGKDVEWVVDVPGVEAKEAWDEYEDIQHYVLYTPEQLEEMEKEEQTPTLDSRVEKLETNTAEIEEALTILLTGATE